MSTKNQNGILLFQSDYPVDGENTMQKNHHHVTEHLGNDPIKLYIGKLMVGGDKLLGRENAFTLTSW